MISYGRQSINDNDIKSVTKVLKSDFLTQGPVVKQFEQNLSNFFKCKHAIAVSSGTAALNLISQVLGWKKNDIIIASPITFISSSNCILHAGATPHFVDINMDDFSIDLNKLEKEIITLLKKRKNLKAVVVTDFAGHPSNWIELNRLKKKYKFKLINDNCHSMGSSINNDYGYAVKYADLVSLSFHPVKNITTGEGGAILTNNNKYSKILKYLSSHGVVRNAKMKKKNGPWYYEMRYLGNNYRMPDINAALGISQLKRIKTFVKRRKAIAKFYDKIFSNNSKFIIPKIKKNFSHSYHLYPLLLNTKIIKKTKKSIFNEFLKNNIKLQVHYIPVNFQPYYKKIVKQNKNQFKNSILFYKRQISLPIYFNLTYKELQHVKKTCKRIFNF